LDFWKRNLEALAAMGQKSILLVGNHDMPHDAGLKMHGLAYASDMCTVVATPTTIDGIKFLPWMPTHEEFVAGAGTSNVVICHAEFQGSKYDSGMFAPNGIDPESFPAHTIISGHIHKPASFGKVWHPGAPRWRTASDANTDRAIWLIEVGSELGITSKTEIYTRGFCKALYHIEDIEGVDHPTPEIVQPARVTVNVRGSAEYVNARKGMWGASVCSVATFPTKVTTQAVKESDGIATALMRHLESHTPKHGTPLEVLKKMVQERITVP
jgi:hypothetical protein